MVAVLCGFAARPRLRPHAGPAPRRRYERRRPEKTPLHKIISENLASWLEWRDEAERPVPGYVEEELRGYLECGILCFSLRPCPLHGLRPGVCDRVLVQGARGLPVLQWQAHGADCRAPCRSRDSTGARATVGDLRAEEITGFSRRSACGRRRSHKNLH